MNPLWLVVIILLVVAVGGMPHWSYAQNWNTGYFPTGVSLVLIVVLIVLLLR